MTCIVFLLEKASLNLSHVPGEREKTDPQRKKNKRMVREMQIQMNMWLQKEREREREEGD